jgi:hypothetical protein
MSKAIDRGTKKFSIIPEIANTAEGLSDMTRLTTFRNTITTLSFRIFKNFTKCLANQRKTEPEKLLA